MGHTDKENDNIVKASALALIIKYSLVYVERWKVSCMNHFIYDGIIYFQ